MAGSLSALSGTFAGRYTIERELGRGATATVYLARDTERSRLVAIKVLRPELAESVGAERFLREIKISEGLNHPHIVPVLDAGEVDGRLYFVLPNMEGGSLRQRLDREKQLPVEEAIAITRTVAEALDYAHKQGLIHRDVKPENILFTSDQACLADFGIARAIERVIDESTTSTGLVRGTPAYMSPEQASGSVNYDGRSDQYSLALVLYEMLAGVPAFIGATPESVIAMRFQHKPRELHVYRPAVNPAVERVIEKALAISKADRYTTAAEFSTALEAGLRSPIVETRPSGPLARLLGQPRIAIPLLAIIATIVTAVLVLPAPEPPATDTGIPEGDPRRIAVFYFDNLSPDKLPSYVATGLTEDLIDQLGSVGALHVISPNGVRPFRDRTLAIDSAAEALKVGTIVSGSVARSGNTTRVTVRLVDAASGRQLHSQVIDEPWTELFVLQGRLSEQVAFFLRQRLGDAIAIREHRAATRSLAAWESVQLASEATRRGLEAGILRADSTPRHFLLADSLYARASSQDPSWALPVIRRSRIALALAVHASAYLDNRDSVTLTMPQRRWRWIRRSIDFANAALEMNPTSPEALGVRGDAFYMLMSTGGGPADSLAPLARRDLERAALLRPDYAWAWATLAQLARFEARFAEASEAARKAYEADAFFEVSRIAAVGFFAALHAGEIEQARRWCTIGQSRYPGDPRFAECRLTLLGWTGRTRSEVADAWRELSLIERRDTLRMLAPTWKYRRLMVAAITGRTGLRDSARAILRQIEAEQSRDPSKRGSPMVEAYVLLLLQDADEALDRLARYLQETPQNRAQVRAHPWFRELRGDARFQELTAPPPLPLIGDQRGG